MSDLVVSRYRILEGPLIPGGVFSAQDLQSGGSVNVQLLPASASQDSARFDRLKRDLEILADISHPNISPVLDFAQSEDGFLVVTPQMTGESLAGWQLAVDLIRVTGFAIQITDALTAAHLKGLVHGGIRPSNIWVTPDLAIKILHFGTAEWCLPSEPKMAVPQSFDNVARAVPQCPADPFETTRYLSPEQVRQAPIDARSDIFSFGAVLFRLVTNQHAFRGNTVETIRASILRRFPDMRAVLDPLFRSVLDRALQKEPGLRYQNMAELRMVLKSIHLNLTSEDARQPVGKTIANYRVLEKIKSKDRIVSYGAEQVPGGERVIFVALPQDYATGSWRFEKFKQYLIKEASEHPAIVPLREIGKEGLIAFVVLDHPHPATTSPEISCPESLRQSSPLSPYHLPQSPREPIDYTLYINLAMGWTEMSEPLHSVLPERELAPITITGLIITFLVMGSAAAIWIWYLFFR